MQQSTLPRRGRSLKWALILLCVAVFALVGSVLLTRSRAAAPFTFIAWGDSRDGTSSVDAAVLGGNAAVAKQLGAKFTLFSGDICASSYNSACHTSFRNALTPALHDITFVSAGNHDGTRNASIASLYNFADVATRVGATGFSGDDWNYSFYYDNSFFVFFDQAVNVTTLDTLLTAAEAKGVTHSFINVHVPISWVSPSHTEAVPTGLVAVINKHPSVSAFFAGHSHVSAYTDLKRALNTTRPVEQFVLGSNGAPRYACADGRNDWCDASFDGFGAVTVNGANFSVNVYKSGTTTPVKTYNFTKASAPGDTSEPTVSVSASPGTVTAGTAVTLSATATDNVGVTRVEFYRGSTLISSDTSTPYSASLATTGLSGALSLTAKAFDAAGNIGTSAAVSVTVNSSTPGIVGDTNSDGRVNAMDLSVIISHDNQNYPPADFNADGSVGAADLAILLSKWTW